jgi:hypothetical protein
MATKRKGWRRGKTSEGRMRLANTYRNEKRELIVQQQEHGMWFFYGEGAGNSLCLNPPQTFADPLDAMKAAEAAQGQPAQRDDDGTASGGGS